MANHALQLLFRIVLRRFISFLGVVGFDFTVTQIQQLLDNALPAGCVSFVVHSLQGATITHPLITHLLLRDEVSLLNRTCYMNDSRTLWWLINFLE